MKKFFNCLVYCLCLFFVVSANGMARTGFADKFILLDVDERLFEVRDASLWRNAFVLPYVQDSLLPGSVNRDQIIRVPLVQDALHDIDFLLSHLDDEDFILKNLYAGSSLRLINLLRSICLLGIKKKHKLSQLVLRAHAQRDIEKLARISFDDFCNFCKRIQGTYPFVQQALKTYISLVSSSLNIGVGGSSLGEGFESSLKTDCGERDLIEERRMALSLSTHASRDSEGLFADFVDLSLPRECMVPIEDVDLSYLVALIDRSDIDVQKKEQVFFNELVSRDLPFLNAALKTVCRDHWSYSDQFVHLLAQGVAYKYYEDDKYNPDNPDAFILLFKLWDNEYPSIADSLKMYMYLFLPHTHRRVLNNYLTDHISVEGFVRQNPEFNFLQGRCVELLEACPSLSSLFKCHDLSAIDLYEQMYALVDNNYGPFWGALVDRGACKHAFSWESVFWENDVDMLRRMSVINADMSTQDPRAIDPNEIIGEKDKKDKRGRFVHDDGMPVLTYLAFRGNEKLVQVLLDKGADPFLSINGILKLYWGQAHNESMRRVCAVVIRKAYQIEEERAVRSPMFKNVAIVQELFALGVDPFSLIKHLPHLTDEIRGLVLERAYQASAEELFTIMRYGSSKLRKRIFERLPHLLRVYRLWHIRQKMKEKTPEVYGRRSSEIGRTEAAGLRRVKQNRRAVLPGNPERHYSVDDLSIYPTSTISLGDLGESSLPKMEETSAEIEVDNGEQRWADSAGVEMHPEISSQRESFEEVGDAGLVSCSSPKNKKGCCTIL